MDNTDAVIQMDSRKTDTSTLKVKGDVMVVRVVVYPR